MRILCIGDVVGKCGCEFLRPKLKALRETKNIDFVIANGENSAEGNGVTILSAEHLFRSGVDVITLGNHTFARREIREYLDSHNKIIRPANYPSGTTPGFGVYKSEFNGIKIGIANILGTVFLESLKSPFETLDEVIAQMQDCHIRIVDFHAEATAEKRALGFYADGKVSAIFGTHTHVQTSDETILPLGTGYITDVGMTGVIDSVLGVKKEISIERFSKKLPIKFQNASGPCKMECIIFEIDEKTGKAAKIERLRILPGFGGLK